MLSKDYSPFGKFATQILQLTLLFSVSGLAIAMTGYMFFQSLLCVGIGVPLFVFGLVLFVWGMGKQDRELFGKK